MATSLCLLQPALARADGSDSRSVAERSFAVGIDVMVVRPLATIAVAVGAAFFVPAVILTSPNGKDAMHQALEKFILIPSENAFQRPLGDF